MGEEPVPGCPACHATPKDLFPDWDQKCAEADAAGLTRCPKCGFEHYLTSDECPLCGTGVLCVHCGKDIREHKHKTRECPAGRRSRIGFLHYGPQTFQGPRLEKK